MRRVNRAPAILAGVWALTLLVSLPLALALREMLAQHLGSSLAADPAAGGTNYEWMQEFSDQATGLGVTFKPTILGFGAVLDNLSAFLDDTTRPLVIVGAASAYIVLWMFLAGGIIDRLRARPPDAHARRSSPPRGCFSSVSLRLAVVQWLVYAFLFGWVHHWLFGRLFTTHHARHDGRAHGFSRARRRSTWCSASSVAACNLVFDYTKVRAVVEDRRSMLGSIVAAVRFIGRNYGAAVTLYLLNFALFLAAGRLYAAVAPGAGAPA